MFKNNYDTDITTWSPAGRLYQVDYAMEAVKQGSATVGVKSGKYVVLVALKRSPTAELSSYQEKIFMLDTHLGVSISGLVSDARHLARVTRTDCMNHRYLYGTNAPVCRIAEEIGGKCQRHIQFGNKRPFGVGLLLAGYDDNFLTFVDDTVYQKRGGSDEISSKIEVKKRVKSGPKLFQILPTGDVFDFRAIAMGSRSQSARTYLEKHFGGMAPSAASVEGNEDNNSVNSSRGNYLKMSLQELITHALKALASTASENVKLNTQNTSIAIVGEDTPFHLLSDDEARLYLDALIILPEDIAAAEEEEDNEDNTGEAGSGGTEGGAPMDLDE